jgi:hypothetical protein
MNRLIRRTAIILCFIALSSFAVAQDTQPAKSAEPAKPISAFARLTTARTAYVKRAAGADVAFDAIRYAIEGWGRFALVDKPENADITIEVSAPGDAGSGVAVSSTTTSTNSTTGRPEQTSNTTRNFSSGGGPVKLTVYDSKTKMLLFVASEQAKSAMKQKAREDNLVEAASKLVTKFRERVEPTAGQ